MASGATPPEPPPEGPPPEWEHFGLYQAVNEALYALPSRFRSDLVISGVRATDLFTFNASLGATIEEQVVDGLNALRDATWDPDEQYAGYSFVRQPQTFPDVVLKAATSPEVPAKILMGIELKGWYVLAKEGEPSFRYTVTPGVCAPQDLLVVFPWTLDRVISGSPELYAPFVTPARYAAEFRNWHWKHARRARSDTTIHVSTVTHHYPTKSDEISDRPASDSGGNFGRFARTGLMDAYMAALFRDDLGGIPLDAWRRFLALFSQETTEDDINRELNRMAEQTTGEQAALSSEAVEAIRDRLEEIVGLLRRQPLDGGSTAG